MNLTWKGQKLDWVNVAYFGVIHAVALTAPWHFSWRGLGASVALYWLACSAGICLGFHRLLTHRGLSVPKWLEYTLTVLGTLTSQGGAITWVAMHRVHHTLSDRPGRDLHTPQDGFWWSHIGWVLCKPDPARRGLERREVERQHAPELVADRFQRVLNRVHVLPNVLVGLALFAWAGWSAVVWGVFVRVVVCLHATWFVNSAAHTWGYRTYATPEGSRNLWWVGLIAWGEGWHNNHHAFPRSARHGLRWWEVDATWLLVRGLRAVGLARDVQLLPKGAERFRLDRAEAALPQAA